MAKHRAFTLGRLRKAFEGCHTHRRARSSFVGTQGIFKKDNRDLSSRLNEKAHEFRKFRNDVAHHGYSPKDDEKCLELFFDAGVPYFDCLLKFLFKKDKEDLSGDHGKWFWQIYRDTRKAIQKKRKKKVESYEAAIVYLQLASRKAFSTGTVAQPIYVSHEKLGLLSEHFQDLDWQIEQLVRNTVIEGLEAAGSDCFELRDAVCPLCTSETLGAIGWGDEGFEVKRVVCLDESCPAYNHVIKDPEVIDIFYTSRMSEATIAYLESDEREPVQKIRI